jgi:hypothetical protein
LTGDPIANIKLLEDPGKKLGRHHERVARSIRTPCDACQLPLVALSGLS